jgi:hypothetical protein
MLNYFMYTNNFTLKRMYSILTRMQFVKCEVYCLHFRILLVLFMWLIDQKECHLQLQTGEAATHCRRRLQ